jgi:hypothetical protein
VGRRGRDLGGEGELPGEQASCGGEQPHARAGGTRAKLLEPRRAEIDQGAQAACLGLAQPLPQHRADALELTRLRLRCRCRFVEPKWQALSSRPEYYE